MRRETSPPREQPLPYTTEFVSLRICDIIILPQIRKTVEGIPELAENIREHGLINPVTVAYLGKEEAQKHAHYFAQIFCKEISFDAFPEYDPGYYCILIAGERRTRATQYIGNEHINAMLCKGISAEEAIQLQIAENIREPVLPQEEAFFIDKAYRFYMKDDLSLAEFSRKMQRGPETIKSALRFSKIPTYIQKAVDEKVISFGTACELGRLYEHGVRDQELKDWFVNAVLHDYPVKKFQKLVKKFLAEKDQQSSMLALFSVEEEREAKKQLCKRTIDQKIADAFHYQSRYFLKVLYLFEHQFLGLEDSPFSLVGPLNAFETTIRLLKEKIIPHLEEVVSNRKKKSIQDGSRILKRASLLVREAKKNIVM